MPSCIDLVPKCPPSLAMLTRHSRFCVIWFPFLCVGPHFCLSPLFLCYYLYRCRRVDLPHTVYVCVNVQSTKERIHPDWCQLCVDSLSNGSNNGALGRFIGAWIPLRNNSRQNIEKQIVDVVASTITNVLIEWWPTFTKQYYCSSSSFDATRQYFIWSHVILFSFVTISLTVTSL